MVWGRTLIMQCLGCHEPVRKNDYVYTLPLPRAGGAR